MAFDGIFTGKTVAELQTANESHIDKIYQPSSNEIYLTLRKKGFVKRLLLSVAGGMQRVHFTERKPENPEKPPMFCMLMRKHFSSAKLLSVTQSGFERIIELNFEATNEMGDRVGLKIICELIGNMSNIIMVDGSGRIIDALKRSDISENKRLVQPGAIYTYPELQDKLNVALKDYNDIYNAVMSKKELPVWKSLLDTLGGLSPLTAREIVYRSGISDITVGEIKNGEGLKTAIGDFKNTVVSSGKPIMIIKDGMPFDFSYTHIEQYGTEYETKEFETCGEMLDAFYENREKVSVQRRVTGEVLRLVNTLITRANKRMANRMQELIACEERENLRIYGEILKANIGKISTGLDKVRLPNFYDENYAEVEIKLDPSLSPANNAAKYFKEYKKKNTAAVSLKELIEEDKKETEYLETVKDNLSRCETVADLREIKEELSLSGYIKNRNNGKKSKSPALKFKEYKSAEGYRIIVGKNNVQNDYLTLKLASKQDLWFHTKNIHGSHVVVLSGGNEISEETVLFAARLAAENSKASESSNVPVDYTVIKNVKKPSGAKPGMVIYEKNKTVFVTPQKNIFKGDEV